MADRRRINGPSGGTTPPVYRSKVQYPLVKPFDENDDPPKLFLKTGLTPSASGSAYLEVEDRSGKGPSDASDTSLNSSTKISCTVHGPRPLPRSASFSPNLLLSTHVKFAPFATKKRRGYLRDPIEKDLAAHLETALRGVIIGERWPKSGVDVVITILEAEETSGDGRLPSSTNFDTVDRLSVALLQILSHCMTVASAAILDAGIDCVDVVVGGTAALIQADATSQTNKSQNPSSTKASLSTRVTPDFHHSNRLAAAAVGYLPSRQEIVELWVIVSDQSQTTSTDIEHLKNIDRLVECAIHASESSQAALKEAMQEKLGDNTRKGQLQLNH